MKRKALRVRSEGSIPTYVTEAESRKQHRDSPLCNSPSYKQHAKQSPPLSISASLVEGFDNTTNSPTNLLTPPDEGI